MNTRCTLGWLLLFCLGAGLIQKLTAAEANPPPLSTAAASALTSMAAAPAHSLRLVIGVLVVPDVRTGPTTGTER